MIFRIFFQRQYCGRSVGAFIHQWRDRTICILSIVEWKNHRCIFLNSIVARSHKFFFMFCSLFCGIYTFRRSFAKHIYSFYIVHCRQWEVHDAPNTINNNTICRLFLQNLQSACKHTVRAACDKFGFINNEITSVGNPLFHMPFRLSAWKFWFELVFAANFSLPENAWFVVRNKWNSEKSTYKMRWDQKMMCRVAFGMHWNSLAWMECAD